MNNSLIERPDESVPETREEKLHALEGDLVKAIDAVVSLTNTTEWSTLKKTVFDPTLSSLERKLAQEAMKTPLDEKEMYRLQGQIVWARRYSDPEQLAETLRLELTNVRKQLNPPTERVIAQD